MEQPTYVRRLLNQKVLLIIGLVVAVLAGLLAGFKLDDGSITTRVTQSYMASSTVLLTSPNPLYLQVEVPGQTQALPTEGTDQPLITTEATPLNLADSAILLAYLASSDQIASTVEERLGGFEEGDAITSVRRTTQPAGDEAFGGRLTLPIIDIVGVANSPARAEQIAAEATTVFDELVKSEQVEWGVPEDIRLVLQELNAPVAGEGEGSNPAIPIVVVAFGVILLFIALALIIEAIRARKPRRDGTDEDESDESGDSDSSESDAADEEEAEGDAPYRRSRRSATQLGD